MADVNPNPKFDVEFLTALSEKLSEDADQAPARKDVAQRLHWASEVCDRLAALRFEVARIAQAAFDNPAWHNASIARDLMDALEQAERG